MRIQTLVPILLAASAGCSAQAPVGDTEQAIENGTQDSGDPAVGLVWRADKPELCSGTLITPSIVLTAGHCLGGLSGVPTFYTGPGIGGSFNPFHPYDPSQDLGLSAHAAAQYELAPGFVDNHCQFVNGAVKVNVNDLALVRLSSGVYNTYGGYARAGYTMPPVGATVTAVGYGDHSGHVGTKYSGTETITAVDATDVRVQAGSGFAGSGDSGGPLFSNGTIIAETMCHDPNDTTEYYQRTDQLSSWIDGVVQQWEQPCYDACAADYQDCGSDCFCLAAYYTCLRRACGKPEPIISCRPTF